MNDGPRILIFTGDGKGKTTAALGLALRASGHGMTVRIVQFIKADASVGEVTALASHPLIELHQTGLGFVPTPTSPNWAEHQAAARRGLGRARAFLVAGEYPMVILDEICTAVSMKLITETDVLDLLRAASRDLAAVVLTGRGATEGMIALADTVTEMRNIKHGMKSGWPAQDGVER